MLISVLMAVYNAEKTILFSINSILSQTIQDFEIIIVNDASSDNTINIIHSINDEKVKYWFKLL